jgi:glycosyltransferase involved in cell wall biosynthesis
MKIVVLAFAYPPFPASGSQRARKVAHALQSAGHDVLVITSRLPGERKVRVNAGSLKVETVLAWPHPRKFYVGSKRLFEWLRRRRPGTGSHTAAARPEVEVAPAAWKRRLLSLMLLPDDLLGFVPPAIARVIRRFPRGPDLVYTTSPPHSTHLAGLALKTLFKTRWVAEFRDPWTGDTTRGGLHSKASDAVERWLEVRCVTKADQIVAVSEGIAELLAGDWGKDVARKTTVVLNGIDELSPQPAKPAPTGAPFTIVHVGTLYLGRNPTAFFEAIAMLRREKSLTADELQVNLVGHASSFGGVPAELIAERAQVADLVSFTGWIPHERTHEVLAAANLLLLFAQAQPSLVPNKLYEYLAARRPILALADADGETARMLRRAGGHTIVTRDDPESIAAALKQALERKDGDNPSTDQRVLKEWSTESQMQVLCRAVLEQPFSTD